MCGILGYIGDSSHLNLEAWGSLTRHRGPDAFGLWRGEGVALGHNRLSIIDLSSDANQPMHSDDGRHVIVFNGEIFNYLELRRELAGLGVNFRTRSDTEVVLKGYLQWGERLLDLVDGMFAFAIWDVERKSLFAARDHVGIKPFFYAQDGDSFIFGSELKLIQAALTRRPDIRDQSIFEYLIYSYIPAPFSAFSGISKLEPGHCLTLDAGTGSLGLRRWWSVPRHAPLNDLGMDAAADQFRDIFGESVRRRMISDVPIGAFLSGGLDSSMIVAEMAAASPTVSTFSIGYRDSVDYDETEYAKQVAHHLGVQHKVLYPETNLDDIERYIDLILDHFDEPYGNPTVAMVHLLTSAAREHVTVALVGDGGDELLAGYPRHRALKLASRWRGILGPVSPALLSLLRLFPENPGRRHLARHARQYLEAIGKTPADAFQDWSSVVTAGICRTFQTAKTHDGVRDRFIANWFDQGGQDDVSRALYADLNSFLPYNLMEGADRMSMANGFELRVPFVSRRLIEFAAQLPVDLKLSGHVHKAIAKHAYKDKLPLNIIRRPKRGFNPPIWHWLQANEEFTRTTLAGGLIADYTGAAFVQTTLDQFYARKADNSLPLWVLLVAERWLFRLRNPVQSLNRASVH